jgi:hypothetical protein
MARWTCPRCDREFGRTNQPHTCLAGNSVDAQLRVWLTEAFDQNTD